METSTSHTDASAKTRILSSPTTRRFAMIGLAGLVLLIVASRAFAMGAPTPWQNAQTGLSYPLYQPAVTLGLDRAGFKLLSCGTGQEGSVSAEYGSAYRTPANFGKTKGFSIGEGYPQFCANPGIAKPVATKSVNGAKVRVSVYCDPTNFKACTVASGLKNGYVLQWKQPVAKGQSTQKRTQMFLDSSKLTLAQTLQIVGNLKTV